jgi:hypothetical protein
MSTTRKDRAAMSETRTFHIGDILSVTTGRLLSPDGIDGVIAILSFMTGENLSGQPHGLPHAADECAPFLREQFPDLAAVRIPPGVLDDKTSGWAWLTSQADLAGATREVVPLPPGRHTHISLLSAILRAQAVIAAMN